MKFSTSVTVWSVVILGISLKQPSLIGRQISTVMSFFDTIFTELFIGIKKIGTIANNVLQSKKIFRTSNPFLSRVMFSKGLLELNEKFKKFLIN